MSPTCSPVNKLTSKQVDEEDSVNERNGSLLSLSRAQPI